jgi:Zn finger protein HypA/HybF involved in hydrogenase expression
MRKLSHDEYIKRASEKHGGFYLYDGSEYLGSDNNITITCPLHGDFHQRASAHLRGAGCPECKKIKLRKDRAAPKAFLTKAKEIHGGRYGYNIETYVNNRTPMEIVCDTHGIFKQAPGNHVRGYGCPLCGVDKRSTSQSSGTDHFIRRATDAHGRRYDYSKSKYYRSGTKLIISCPTHGDFEQTPEGHYSGKGCPSCGVHISKNEMLIINHVKSLGFELDERNRTLIKPFELDIVIHEKKIAIEYNGLVWHSEKFGKGRNYHKNKTDRCRDKGYRLIHIWEDDFDKDPGRELDFLAHALLGYKGPQVYARKTELREIDKSLSKSFLEANHVQGAAPSSINIGAYYGGELVAVTSFSKNQYGWQLVRHATDRHVIGALGKVCKWFARNVSKKFHTFCDLSRFDGASYLSAGFVKTGEVRPDYRYLVRGERKHKFNFRLKSLSKKFPEHYSKEKTERQIMTDAGIYRIWDCGKARYEYNA